MRSWRRIQVKRYLKTIPIEALQGMRARGTRHDAAVGMEKRTPQSCKKAARPTGLEEPSLSRLQRSTVMFWRVSIRLSRGGWVLNRFIIEPRAESGATINREEVAGDTFMGMRRL